jgi:hypothetical protein
MLGELTLIEPCRRDRDGAARELSRIYRQDDPDRPAQDPLPALAADRARLRGGLGRPPHADLGRGRGLRTLGRAAVRPLRGGFRAHADRGDDPDLVLAQHGGARLRRLDPASHARGVLRRRGHGRAALDRHRPAPAPALRAQQDHGRDAACGLLRLARREEGLAARSGCSCRSLSCSCPRASR